jgi:biotin carboxylase
MSNVLIVGRRSACYRAAIKLAHDGFLWSSQPLHESRKEKLAGWIEKEFELCSDEIPDEVVDAARSFSLDYIVAATESSVMLAAGLRERLGLEGTTVALAEIAHNKFVMKTKAVESNIPITSFHLVHKGDTPEYLASKLGLPLVLKPVDGSGATDVKIARSLEDIARYIAPGLLAEAFVVGTEVSVETFVFDGKPLFHNITDYLHRWQ